MQGCQAKRKENFWNGLIDSIMIDLLGFSFYKYSVEEGVKSIRKRKSVAGTVSARLDAETSIGESDPSYTNSVLTVARLNAAVCWLYCYLKTARSD